MKVYDRKLADDPLVDKVQAYAYLALSEAGVAFAGMVAINYTPRARRDQEGEDLMTFLECLPQADAFLVDRGQTPDEAKADSSTITGR